MARRLQFSLRRLLLVVAVLAVLLWVGWLIVPVLKPFELVIVTAVVLLFFGDRPLPRRR